MDLFKLFRYFNKKDTAFAFICMGFIVCQTWLELRLPDYMSTITTLVKTKGSDMDRVLLAGGKMALCAIGAFLVAVMVGFFASRVASSFAMRLRGEVFAKVMDMSMEEIGKFSTPSLITRSTNDITQVMMLIAVGLKAVVRAPIMATWASVKIIGKHAQWTAVTVAAVAALLTLMIVVFSIAKPKFIRVQSLTDVVNRITREHLSGIRVVHAYNAEDYQEKKFEKANDDLTSTNLFTQRTMSFMAPGLTLIMSLMTLGIYWAGMFVINGAAANDKLPLFSDMVVIYSYAAQVIIAFMMLTITLIIFPRAFVSAKRINEVLTAGISIKDGGSDGRDAGEKGKIEFNNVSFTYPGAVDPILNDISFTADPGQTVAIIGSTGSGKTTLINLIPRFYDATEGEVKVDGIKVSDYRQEALRSRIGYVSQTAVLFSGTVRSNVAFGNKVLPNDDATVKDAIATAQAEEFVSHMEGGIDAKIAQRGSNLSGGQRQRLSIARAICRHPEIYIFDDSFSALDYETDRALRRELKEKTKGATVLIVAQRIGTVMDADMIIVLDEGRIVGKGTHKELLSSCDVYREIAHSQLSKEELENAG